MRGSPAPSTCRPSWSWGAQAFNENADGRITLTNSSSNQAGAAWYPHPMPAVGGYDLTWSLRVGPGNKQGDGITFALLASDAPAPCARARVAGERRRRPRPAGNRGAGWRSHSWVRGRSGHVSKLDRPDRPRADDVENHHDAGVRRRRRDSRARRAQRRKRLRGRRVVARTELPHRDVARARRNTRQRELQRSRLELGIGLPRVHRRDRRMWTDSHNEISGLTITSTCE